MRVLLALVLGACSSNVCDTFVSDFTTEQGVCVETNGYEVSKSDVEASLEIIFDRIDSRANVKQHGLTLTFVDDIDESKYRLPSGWWAEGETIGQDVKVVYPEHSKQLARSYLMHELIHALLNFDGIDSSDHKHGNYFMEVGDRSADDKDRATVEYDLAIMFCLYQELPYCATAQEYGTGSPPVFNYNKGETK